MSTSTKDFISKLSELKKEFKVFVPSAKKEVTASQITLKQQKDIIATSVNGVLGALQFTKAVNDLIIENIANKTFYTFDRVPVLLALRVESLGDKIKNEKGEVVSLNESLEKIKKVPTFKLSNEVKINSINVELRIPTLEEENIILTKSIQEMDKLKSEDLSKAMGLIYIFELIKSVKSVQVEDELIDFDDLKVVDRVKIVEQLPLELYDNITSFLSQFTKYEEEILTINESTIAVDASLLDATTGA
jgi:hypothetical protein|tara:strand:- start:125 stop:865 length:741 start_codon:yes stop_codon:yes gene_type:complete